MAFQSSGIRRIRTRDSGMKNNIVYILNSQTGAVTCREIYFKLHLFYMCKMHFKLKAAISEPILVISHVKVC